MVIDMKSKVYATINSVGIADKADDIREIFRYLMQDMSIEIRDKETDQIIGKGPLYINGDEKSEKRVDELTRIYLERYPSMDIDRGSLDIAKSIIYGYPDVSVTIQGDVDVFGLPDPHNPKVLDKSMHPIDDRRDEDVPEAVTELNKEGHRRWYPWNPYHSEKVDGDPNK